MKASRKRGEHCVVVVYVSVICDRGKGNRRNGTSGIPPGAEKTSRQVDHKGTQRLVVLAVTLEI